jgi:hypothetical protein
LPSMLKGRFQGENYHPEKTFRPGVSLRPVRRDLDRKARPVINFRFNNLNLDFERDS